MAQNTNYNAIDVAKYVVQLSSEKIIGDEGETEGITNLKLQKILYFIEAYNLAVNGESAFSDTIEAWEYGPVVPTVYHELKTFGSDPIFTSDIGEGKELPEELQKVIESVWKSLDKYSAGRLVEITHKHTPWIEAFEKKKRSESTEISREVMAEYYKSIFDE